ncbi:MAG TPA: rhomboid family intramembrane serine protease [Thermodesulfobacteriota bacterium]|nr:rhomboid family intramembrane serine protease [Deltaproteobacteria bacterium]HNR14250.1 rhomboid family intramembrane serine protease [Thermodesulfobacteriota bacterium]HNU71339.1 rhomboid family intramembrane serine protease [Thermodesulfobacteriota bacterium]HQO78778.1 rhomboid family intramembrane serine protease [Thermodesulfobacteriota bacterium]
MIPLRDRNPSRTLPYVSIGLIVVNAAAFFYQLSLGQHLEPFLIQYGLVPARLLHVGESAGVSIGSAFVPLFTSMFFHGGWLHIIGNMWYLWIFGDNVEDRLGHSRFLVFYLLCGIAAGIIHTLFNLSSAVPTIGASGAIAGVLGAYLISFPHARILTAIPIFIFIQIVEIPAIFFLVFWFILQFFSGALSVTSTATSAQAGGIAWWAHVGGFVFGIILVFVFSKRRGFSRRYY